MDLYIIRHARAVDKDLPVDDAHRPLSGRGRRDAHGVGRAMRDAGAELAAIVTSPLVRAVETAELIAVGLGFDDALDVAPELMPGHHPQAVMEEVLLPRADLPSLALVGHEPQLGVLLGALLRARTAGLSKGVAVRLVWEGPGTPARFKWVIRPGAERPSKDPADIG